MTDIAHEMKVRRASIYAGDLGPYVILSPRERDEAVAEIERLRAALASVRCKLHAYNRPTLAQRVRIECRDICDAALNQQLEREG